MLVGAIVPGRCQVLCLCPGGLILKGDGQELDLLLFTLVSGDDVSDMRLESVDVQLQEGEACYHRYLYLSQSGFQVKVAII